MTKFWFTNQRESKRIRCDDDEQAFIDRRKLVEERDFMERASLYKQLRERDIQFGFCIHFPITFCIHSIIIR